MSLTDVDYIQRQGLQAGVHRAAILQFEHWHDVIDNLSFCTAEECESNNVKQETCTILTTANFNSMTMTINSVRVDVI